MIVYPIPLDNEEVQNLFRPFIRRFADSFRANEPGHPYELALMMNHADADAEMAEVFRDLTYRCYRYDGAGFDIGSFQHYTRHCATENVFQVNCVTRVYAHRAGWLKRLVEAREMFGPGLYGTSASREGGKLHVCTRCYAFDSDDFKRYPHHINSRNQGIFFELGDGNLMEWFKAQGLLTIICYWSGAGTVPEPAGLADIYRRGDQSNCLVFDKHTDYYRDSDETEKRRLERMCFEGKE